MSHTYHNGDILYWNGTCKATCQVRSGKLDMPDGTTREQAYAMAEAAASAANAHLDGFKPKYKNR